MFIRICLLVFLSVSAQVFARVSTTPNIFEVIRKTFPKNPPQLVSSIKAPGWFLNTTFEYSVALNKLVRDYKLKFDCLTLNKITWNISVKNADTFYKTIRLNVEEVYWSPNPSGYESRLMSSVSSVSSQKGVAPNGYIFIQRNGKTEFSRLVKFFIKTREREASIYLCEAQKR